MQKDNTIFLNVYLKANIYYSKKLLVFVFKKWPTLFLSEISTALINLELSTYVYQNSFFKKIRIMTIFYQNTQFVVKTFILCLV